MTIEEAKYILRNTAFLAPSLVPVDEAVDMACDALDKVAYINSQLGNADRKTEPQTNADQHAQHIESVETMSCQECKWWSDLYQRCCQTHIGNDCKYEPKDEPQTDCAWKKGE